MADADMYMVGDTANQPPEVVHPESNGGPQDGEKVVQVNGVPSGRATPPASGGNNQVQVSVISGSKETPMVSTMNMEPGGAEPDSVEALQQEKRNMKPLWYCRKVTERPKTVFGILLAMHLFMVLVTVILLRAGYDILPISFERLPLDIRDDPDYLRGLAWQERTESSDYIIDRNELSDADQTERSVLSENVELYFEQPGGNVFTQENMVAMKRVEEKYYTNAAYQSKFCQLNGGVCMKPNSILRYFDGSYRQVPNTGDIFREDPNFERILEIFNEAESNPVTKKHLQYFLGKHSVIDASTAQSEITRCTLPVGKPLKGYTNSTDREDKQDSEIEDFMVDEFKPLGDDYFEDGVGKMDFFYNSPTLLSVTIQSQVYKDMALAVGSMAFIVFFMCLQTGSFWISGWAIFSIICAFFTTNILYRVILDFRYFGIFHVLAIFIILGVGADDVFVMFDTWKESAHHHYPSLAHRLSDVYRNASFAMLFTSLTTGLAFIVSAFSPFLGVSTFGVFAGILVGVNYLSIILFFPTVMITYHLYWDRFKCCCCCPRYGVSGEQNTPSKSTARKNPIVRFFRGPYFTVVTHKIARWVILAVNAGVLIFFIYYCSKLQVNEEQVKFLKDSSNFGKYMLKRDKAFRPTNADGSTRVLLVWGMKKQDIGSCHHTDPECYGNNVWDDNFNLNSDAAQNALMLGSRNQLGKAMVFSLLYRPQGPMTMRRVPALEYIIHFRLTNLCEELRNLDSATIKKLAIRSDIVHGQPEVQCFIERIGVHLQQMGMSIPVGKTEANAIMAANTDVYDVSQLGADFTRYFEIAMSYWLYDDFNVRTSHDIGKQFLEYNDLLGVSLDPPHTHSKILTPAYKYYYGTKLSYAVVAVNTTIQSATQGYPSGLPIRDAWEDFLNEKMSKMPAELKKGFQLSASGPLDFNLWHWLKVQKNLVYNAVLGMIIGVMFALPILIIATMNIVVGLLSTVIIVCITITVVGLIPLGGWKLGLLESLNLVLVVGLAVDYVVHLAQGYSRSSHSDRKSRVRDALEEVGISVLSGALTTLGASMLLLFAEILFFTQFGIFMFGTIGFSIFYALGLFITVMGMIGPQGEFGSLQPLFKKIKARCCKPRD